LTGLEYLRHASDLLDHGLTVGLHAYQCHVFLDWHELRPTAEQSWDRLCDWLNGRGVSSLDDELVNLELRPVHNALRQLLDPGMVRSLAGFAEHPRAVERDGPKKPEQERNQFLKYAWECGDAFFRESQAAYVERLRQANQPVSSEPAEPASLAQDFSRRLRAAMRLPQVEALFPAPWTAAARRMLPSPSPQFTATAMWGPVLGWCALELLAESIDPVEPERAALDLFDRLRLRGPFAHAFGALGFEGEEAWHVAARIKVLLLTGSGVATMQEAAPPTESEAFAAEAAPAPEPSEAREEKVMLAPALWLDPDVRWLCGVHESGGHFYLIRERYEELLWWLLMPALLNLAGEDAPNRLAVRELSNIIEAALASAEDAGYRVDALLGKAANTAHAPAPEAEPGHRREPARQRKP
jgi:hypothetical protein